MLVLPHLEVKRFEFERRCQHTHGKVCSGVIGSRGFRCWYLQFVSLPMLVNR
jgi:hypothetical protein